MPSKSFRALCTIELRRSSDDKISSRSCGIVQPRLATDKCQFNGPVIFTIMRGKDIGRLCRGTNASKTSSRSFENERLYKRGHFGGSGGRTNIYCYLAPRNGAVQVRLVDQHITFVKVSYDGSPSLGGLIMMPVASWPMVLEHSDNEESLYSSALT